MNVPLDYLRISVTDRCNLRCCYCRPENEPVREEHTLSAEAVERFVRAAASCGVKKVRLTGGEPLLHENILRIVASIARVPGLRSLGMTTNGVLLAPAARELRSAGLKSVNVSLPSLDPEKFRRMTGGGSLREVRAGIEAALSAGFHPVKINTVVVAGVNDGEIAEIASLARDNPVEVRFIEYMPFVQEACGSRQEVVSAGDVLDALRKAYGELEPAPGGDPHSAASMFTVQGFTAAVGTIPCRSRPFCSKCNRIRLSAAGKVRACLVEGRELDVRRYLTDGLPADGLAEIFERLAEMKPARHDGSFCGDMYRIGG